MNEVTIYLMKKDSIMIPEYKAISYSIKDIKRGVNENKK